MADSVTIQVELLLPALALQVGAPDIVKQWLQTVGVLAPGAEHCRWRIAAEAGGYALSYDVTVPLPSKEPGA